MSTSWLFNHLVAAWVLPPLNLLLLAFIGLLLMRRRRRLGGAVVTLSLGLLALLSMPAVSQALIGTLEDDWPLMETARAQASGARAIVILGGGRNRRAFEFDARGETVSEPTLARVRYGARLARTTGLPLLVSGGRPDGGLASEAELMAEALEQEFGVKVRWREMLSDDTMENARYSAQLLREAGVVRVLLVTDAMHMTRAMARFRAAGLDPVAAPTNFRSGGPLTPVDFLPSAWGLRVAYLATREWIGLAVSRMRGV